MSEISAWSTTASSNNDASPDGWPEGMAPSGVNDSARENMAAIRTWYEDAEWREWGHAVTYASATSFTTSSGDGDTTGIYVVGRRVRAVGSTTGTIYGRITASSFSTTTTVTVVWDSGSLSNEAIAISVGFLATPSAPWSGVVQQVHTQTGAVATGTTPLPSDDTIPQNDEGDQYMTLAITPESASNILVIDVVFIGSISASTNNRLGVALFQDSTAGALAATAQTIEAGAPLIFSFRHRMTAGTTSATTFKVRAGSNVTGTTTFNGLSGGRILGGVMASSITITEVAP